MFGFFKSKPPVNDKSFLINITDKGVIINGRKKFSLPCDMKRLNKIFGSPRAAMFETDRENKEFLEATCFGVRINEKPVAIYPQTPKTSFKGVITVNGAPWLSTVKQGEDCEVFFNYTIGGFSVIAEFTDDEIDPQERGEQDFTEIEVQKG